jgi:2-polyprenyl-3-methyl-5-hydroxy-6-metoxy-1,4-benzoquinol methylase
MNQQNIKKIEDIKKNLYDLNSIVAEIVSFTAYKELEVWKRACFEMLRTGYNVEMRARQYGVTPHVFDDKMIELYRNSDGFIFETLLETLNAFRMKKWLNIVNFVLAETHDASSMRILIYGDSVGSDSIFLKYLGYDVYYHDFDSYCSKFAFKRFADRKLVIKRLSDHSDTLYDFIICLEVAEHVPDPCELIKGLGSLLKPSGYCIFSESFDLIDKYYPTHLQSNLKYKGKIDSIFEKQGMYVVWRDVHNKPIIYSRNKTFKRFLYGENIYKYLSKLYRFRSC